MQNVGDLLLAEVQWLRDEGLLDVAPRQNEVEYAFLLVSLPHDGVHSTVIQHTQCYQAALRMAIRVVHCGQSAIYISGNPIEALIDRTNRLIQARKWCVELVASVVVERNKPPFPWNHAELAKVSGWAYRLKLWEQFHQLVDHMYMQ